MLTFFRDATTASALRVLAASPRLRVIAGAGVSMEVGLPSWSGLVNGMLREVVVALWPEEWPRFEQRVRDNPLLAAELVDSLSEQLATSETMDERIRRHLYQGADPAALQPGPLAGAIAELQRASGRHMRIATTNYDELLEGALRALPDRTWSYVKTYVQQRGPGADTVVVNHLHGVLGKRTRGKIILSEGDYHRMQRTSERWQQKMVAAFLSDPGAKCLFVGVSLTDSNMLRYLYNHAAGRHYALFVRPEVADNTEQAAWEEAETLRWRRLGITPLYADNYADVTQFVHELAYRRDPEMYGRPQAFLMRLRLHLDRAQRAGVLVATEDTYAELQRVLSSVLQRMLEQLRDVFRSHKVVVDSEGMQLGLWSVYPPEAGGGQERLLLVASSDRVMTSPSSIAPVPLDRGSDWIAVQSVCRGLPMVSPVSTYASRWRYVRAVPVFSQLPRVPLGAVTLASHSTNSAMATMPDALKAAVDSALRQAGRLLLQLR